MNLEFHKKRIMNEDPVELKSIIDLVMINNDMLHY